MPHVVLLGDSIFDNAAFVGGGPDVVAQLRRGLPLIDLRLVCDEAGDYANPIEPSVQGGAKIAAAIASLVAGHDWPRGRSAVFLC